MSSNRTKIVIAVFTVALLVAVAGLSASYAADLAAGSKADSRADDFKVIGYYCGEWFDVPVEKLQAEKLTHVIYGFLIPTADGGFLPFLEPGELKQLIGKCHGAGTLVYVSVGGYSDKSGSPLVSVFEKIASDDKLLDSFIGNVMDTVNQYGFDGVEIDWEYPSYATGSDYEKMVLRLADALHPLGKGLSTALPGTGSTDGQNVWEGLAAVTEKALSCFDIINLMCYDLKSDPNHSPVWFSVTSINYMKNFKNVPADKLILGMPLYARPSWEQYRFLVDMDKGNAYLDYVDTKPLGSSYNGLNTLREKTMIAFRKAGGVMLFDVNEDTYDETSAVSMIYDTVRAMDVLSDKEINDYIWVVADNHAVAYTAKDGMGTPFIDENSRTLVPVRKLLESIGASVSYETGEKGLVTSVSAERSGILVTINIGSSRYSVNGESRAMDTVAIIKDGRTYLPARPVLEAFGYDVSYSEAGKTVYAVSTTTGPELTALNINGGTTGVFQRKQLHFAGFDGISAEVTLPFVTELEKGDCPYVYFGFDWEGDKGNVEGGFQYIEDPAHPLYNKWTVFMRQGSEWNWGSNISIEQGETHRMSFYAEYAPAGFVDLVIELDGKEAIRKKSAVGDFENASVKTVISMAMTKKFDGQNCFSKSIGARVSDVKVRKCGQAGYTDFGGYPLYSSWRPDVGASGMWYGTSDCVPSYIHYEEGGKISIYR